VYLWGAAKPLGAAWAPRALSCGPRQPCQAPRPGTGSRAGGLLPEMPITPGTRHCLATESWRAALALCLSRTESDALEWDIELWEPLSLALTFSSVSASSPEKGNICYVERCRAYFAWVFRVKNCRSGQMDLWDEPQESNVCTLRSYSSFQNKERDLLLLSAAGCPVRRVRNGAAVFASSGLLEIKPISFPFVRCSWCLGESTRCSLEECSTQLLREAFSVALLEAMRLISFSQVTQRCSKWPSEIFSLKCQWEASSCGVGSCI